MVVLVAYGNATVKDQFSIQSIDQHSTFKFHEWTIFRHVASDVIFARTPPEYLRGLKGRGVRGLLLTSGANSSLPDGLSERLSAGFVGGGKQYLIQEFTDSAVNLLALQSELGDRDREDQKMWRNTFQQYHTSPRQIFKPERPDLDWTEHKLTQSLNEVIKFCNTGESQLKASHWPELFAKAKTALSGNAPVDATDHLQLPEQVFNETQNKLLKAADLAWVFGGMGSWNDVAFQDDQLSAKYNLISERLYGAVNMAIIGAVNSGSTVFNLPPCTAPLRNPNAGKPWWKVW